MTDFIVGFVVTLISVTIGYILGSSKPGEGVQNITKSLTGWISLPRKVGAVKRPNAREVLYRDKPWLKEEDDVMKETFDTLNKPENENI
jgi:hypothetical protein